MNLCSYEMNSMIDFKLNNFSLFWLKNLTIIIYYAINKSKKTSHKMIKMKREINVEIKMNINRKHKIEFSIEIELKEHQRNRIRT